VSLSKAALAWARDMIISLSCTEMLAPLDPKMQMAPPHVALELTILLPFATVMFCRPSAA